MHLTSRNKLALSKYLLEKPVTISGLFGVDHIGQEGNACEGPSR